MYSAYNEGKIFVAERFTKTLRSKIYKHMTAFYFDVLNDIVDKYNNTYHRTIKIKLINIKSGSYAEYNVDSNEKDPKFKIGDHVRISSYKNIFAKGYASNWFEEVFVISKIKITVLWTYDSNGEEIARTFCEKDFQKTGQEEFRIEKVIKRIKRMGKKECGNSFNSWADQKGIV